MPTTTTAASSSQTPPHTVVYTTPRPSSPNPALLGDLVGVLIEEEEAARLCKSSGSAPGPRTGLGSLDEELGGFLAPGVHTLLAAPAAGKTALCLQIAVQCGCPVLYVTAEMRRVELLRRLIARTTGTYLGKLRGGTLPRESLMELAADAARQAPMVALYDAAEGGATVPHLQEVAGALRDRFDARHVLVIVDSVTEWAPCAVFGREGGEGAGGMVSDFALAEAAVNGLKLLASRLNCPVIAIAHRHRAGQGKDADRLHSAKGTGRYEYIAESVWDLEREARKEADQDGRTRATITILKNRHGNSGISLPLLFEGRLQKFLCS